MCSPKTHPLRFSPPIRKRESQAPASSNKCDNTTKSISEFHLRKLAFVNSLERIVSVEADFNFRKHLTKSMVNRRLFIYTNVMTFCHELAAST
ncbi:hypothetical protein Bca4012_084170 [Brassica carinata]|uniref:Uncharacterized protein n=1 Tax=Brassica carinata TaxID=52824 RepID=A0A8X7V8Z6_BRACI|nr:hypothetical protein Bca52824_026617 [Brassica carinata]